jgi:hypothetical protein
LTIISNSTDSTTAAFTEFATPAGPPRVSKPLWQQMIATIVEKTAPLTIASVMSPTVAKDANVAMNEPGVPFWMYTLNR